MFGKKKPDRGSIFNDRKLTKFFLNTGVVASRGLAYYRSLWTEAETGGGEGELSQVKGQLQEKQGKQ